MSEKAVQKIRKLLELSKSSNAHEAQLALAKARKMLYGGGPERKPADGESEYLEVRTDVTFTLQRDLWVAYLAEVMAENHACVTYQSHKKKYGKTYTVFFLGKRRNAEVCKKSFEDTVRYFKALNSKVKGGSDTEFQEFFNDYVHGFTQGLKEIYDRQDEEARKAGAVTETVPAEVSKVLNYIRGKKTESVVINRKIFNMGKSNAGEKEAKT